MNHCRVCGLEQAEPPWVEGVGTFRICACCGTEFGYEDCSVDSTIANRSRWIRAGARWFDPKAKPLDWDLQRQLLGVPPAFVPDFRLRAPAADPAIVEGFRGKLPDDYLDFLLESDGGSGYLSMRETFASFWPAAELTRFNEGYEAPPELFLIGTDKGFHAFGFDLSRIDRPVVKMPIVGMDASEAAVVASTFRGLFDDGSTTRGCFDADIRKIKPWEDAPPDAIEHPKRVRMWNRLIRTLVALPFAPPFVHSIPGDPDEFERSVWRLRTKLAKSFDDHAQNGIGVEGSCVGGGSPSRSLRAWCIRNLQGKRMRNKGELMQEFAAALQFPAYFGENWDGLNDCLGSLEEADGYVLAIVDAHLVLCNEVEALPVLFRVLESAAESWISEPPQGQELWCKRAPFHVILNRAAEERYRSEILR